MLDRWYLRAVPNLCFFLLAELASLVGASKTWTRGLTCKTAIAKPINDAAAPVLVRMHWPMYMVVLVPFEKGGSILRIVVASKLAALTFRLRNR